MIEGDSFESLHAYQDGLEVWSNDLKLLRHCGVADWESKLARGMIIYLTSVSWH